MIFKLLCCACSLWKILFIYCHCYLRSLARKQWNYPFNIHTDFSLLDMLSHCPPRPFSSPPTTSVAPFGFVIVQSFHFFFFRQKCMESHEQTVSQMLSQFALNCLSPRLLSPAWWVIMDLRLTDLACFLQLYNLLKHRKQDSIFLFSYKSLHGLSEYPKFGMKLVFPNR